MNNDNQQPQRLSSMERLLRPRSVVVVGASATPGALGASVMTNLERFGFSGDVHLVNPNRPTIGNRPCLKSVDDLPMGVDVAVLAIPRVAVLPTVKALAARGVGAAIIFSAGFAEGGEAGAADQAELARIAADAGMVIEGPNCLGLVNYVEGIALTFVETPTGLLKGRPGIAIVSQSGAMAAVVAVTLGSKGLGVSYSISTGNEAASGVEDYVEYLIDDVHTQVIALVVEQFRKPKKFLDLARRARAAGKPIVLLHPGRSSAARESAATHTGALAGDYAVMRTQVEAAGVVLAGGLEEFGDILDIVSRCRTLPSRGTGVLTESGAFKALTLDMCEEFGIALPHLDEHNAPLLRAALPDFVPVSNPVDITAQALVDPDLYRRVVAALLADERFGCVVLVIIQTDAVTSKIKFPPIIGALEALQSDKPVIFAGLDDGALVPPDYLDALRRLNIPYFPTPGRAYRAVAALVAASARVPAVAEPILARPLDLSADRGTLTEYRSKELLQAFGLSFPERRMVQTMQQAQDAAAELGFPVVLKAQSPELPHKSDAGGVILGMKDAQMLAAGWDRLHANIARSRPGMTLSGVLVERMSKMGTELIIGGRNDKEWGPLVLVGFGGVQAEILQDVRLLPSHLTTAEIERELHQLKGGELLRGFRGSPALDVGAVATIVSKLGEFLRAHPSIREVDLNPVIVYPQGEGAVALDALLMAD